MDQQAEMQKILFADLYRLIGAIREELKVATKESEKLLKGGDWESVTMLVNSIVSEEDLISRMATAMKENADLFLERGLYRNQGADHLPLEFMAQEA